MIYPLRKSWTVSIGILLSDERKRLVDSSHSCQFVCSVCCFQFHSNMIYPLRKSWTVMTISLKASLRNLRKIDNILIAAEKSICGDAAGLYRKENRSNPELQIFFWRMKLEATNTTTLLVTLVLYCSCLFHVNSSENICVVCIRLSLFLL